MDTEITKKVELLRALLRTKDQFDELIDTGANDEFTDKDKEFMEEFMEAANTSLVRCSSGEYIDSPSTGFMCASGVLASSSGMNRVQVQAVCIFVFRVISNPVAR